MTASNFASLTRARELLNYLAKAPGFVSLKEILTTFKISRRTAFNWLKTINQQLQAQKLDQVVNIPRYGYKLTDRTKKSLTQKIAKVSSPQMGHETILNAHERQTEIILLLLDQKHYLSINQLAKMFHCSRNTIIKDFKALKRHFPALKIGSSRLGHRIISDENSIRLTVYELLLRQDKFVYAFINRLNYSFSQAKELVITAQQQLHMSFSENSLQQLTYLLLFTKWRITHNQTINRSENWQWIAQNTKDVLPTCTKLLGKLGGNKELKGEIVFLSKIFLCSQATEVDCINKNLYHDINNIAQEIIFRYEQLTEQQISYRVFTKTLCNHLYATFFRVKFGIPFSSSEVDEIKWQYPVLIKFTAIACAPLEHYLQKKLPSEEVALICLYFGSVNNREYREFTESDKLKRALLAEVLVVCSSGIGTSAMLYHELSKTYPLIKFSLPLEIRDLAKIFQHNYQAKLIISTTTLPKGKYPIPAVKVKAVLTKHDQTIIDSFLRQEVPRKLEHNASAVNSLVSIINEYADVKDEKGLRLSLDKFIFPGSQKNDKADLPTLSNLLPAKHIKVLQKKDQLKWQTVLKWGCNLLEQDEIIDQFYFEKIVQLINRYGPYMLIANNIFLAHAAPSNSNKKVGLSLILLDQPLEICSRGESAWVTCMFVLSPGKEKEHEKALEQLVDIVRNQENINRLLKAKSPQEVRQFLLSFY
ncbi:PTS sugar transporter subunit IIA [Lactobacillus sp.]|uniref:BglG family transcription antiterminator n=1 Tax=Lactobacillus sp. TaxID=1591 RepID=UPI0025E70286|nr:PTS sugar transporter subunit IIA [Lactobacillus sp.]MCO6530902.1 PTS sugar transporter subunit IIA [Lactobacillus sp.]